MTSPRALLAILVVALLMGGVSALTYQRHATEHLRSPPRTPTCALVARRHLKKMNPVSGTEPHEIADGTTAYLQPAEDKAIRCLKDRSREVGLHLASAFAIQEPPARAKALVSVVRDRLPAGGDHDQLFASAYAIADGALDALPESPERAAASDEIAVIRACRFAIVRECPTRPPIPSLVWLLGLPSALALVFVLGVAIPTGIAKIAERLRRRRVERAPTIVAPPPAETKTDEATAGATKTDEPDDQRDTA